MNSESLKITEKYSSAFTLSDMEIFVFPDLMFSLVLANIMSNRIWQWREHPFLKDIKKMSPTRKFMRLKQFIMDNYVFNLDLDTWGLTKQQNELKRFAAFMDVSFISENNALFGYEGDKYYFDLDIRKHFGLDKYDGDTIPYWKTETVEAMDAFKYKEGYSTGAGECVSLSALYAAALFIILDVPLENIFLIATPLHSQNFIMDGRGFITNNRRIMTKNMWFNGTLLSDKARRALDKENVTIISHLSGYMHLAYKEASINKDKYLTFKDKLRDFVCHNLNYEILTNFLRSRSRFQRYFQFRFHFGGSDIYIEAEKLYCYEHDSKIKIGEHGYKKFLQQVEIEDCYSSILEGRDIIDGTSHTLNNLSIKGNSLIKCKELLSSLTAFEDPYDFTNELCAFTCTKPRLPDENQKEFISEDLIPVKPGMSREEIRRVLSELRACGNMADLAFAAGREVNENNLNYYLHASINRSPCSLMFFQDDSVETMYEKLKDFENISIYDENRLACPDEVINFSRGDGLEKAILMMNVMKSRYPSDYVSLMARDSVVELSHQDNIFTFSSLKKFDFLKKINFSEFSG